MSNILNQLYLIRIDEDGRKSEIPASEVDFQVGGQGTANFGLDSCIIDSQTFGLPTSTVILGGYNHCASGNWNVIGGGIFNNIYSQGSFIGGGIFNNVYGGTASTYSTIGGGCRNRISGVLGGAVLGGYDNLICNTSPSDPSANQSIIVGGQCNSIIGRTFYSAILGGQVNVIASGTVQGIGIGGISEGGNNLIGTSRGSVIDNRARASTILNGQRNHIWGANTCFNSIINGFCSYLSGTHSTIINGRNNFVTGSFGVILNGTQNKIFSNYGSILAGTRSTIQVDHSGAVLLSDSQDRDHTSAGSNTLTLDFASGTFIKNKIILENSYIPSSSASFGVSGIRWRRTALAEW
jgi:hypothetical protein